jgi:hypothetical protein
VPTRETVAANARYLIQIKAKAKEYLHERRPFPPV